MRHRFHVLGFPHTQTNRTHICCAYTQKLVKLAKMLGPHHEIFDYSNEGFDTTLPVIEHVDILSNTERESFFGEHDPQRLYDLRWEGAQPYWKLFNERAIEALTPRVQKGDFILTLAGADCHQAIGNAFPGSYSDVAQTVMMVEAGIGYYGTFSRYRVFESHGHREWLMGNRNQRVGDFDTAVIPNYFDLSEFPDNAPWPFEDSDKPYYLFIGRIIPDKGWEIAVEVTAELGCELVVAGQGSPGRELPPHVIFVGAADVEQRAMLMRHATAVFAPTVFREPFGGVAVEAQLSGCPAITTDWGAFVETVTPEWRCSTHREFVMAAERAAHLTDTQRQELRWNAARRYSLEAVRPLYERYFDRLYSLWGKGYYEAALTLQER